MKFTVTIEDQDALDALNAEIARIAAAGTQYTEEEYLSDFCTTQHRVLREPQLLAAAMAKVAEDPDLKAFRDKKTAEAQAEAEAAAVATQGEVNAEV